MGTDVNPIRNKTAENIVQSLAPTIPYKSKTSLFSPRKGGIVSLIRNRASNSQGGGGKKNNPRKVKTLKKKK